jgi:short-subunit dehydrogenase
MINYLLGLNIILISRTKEKLEQVAKEIQSQNSNTQVKTIAVDFTSEIISDRIRILTINCETRTKRSVEVQG